MGEDGRDDGLTLVPPEGRRRRKAPAKPKPGASLTVVLERRFRELYEQTWGFPYFQTSVAEDRKHLKGIGEQLGEADGLALVEAFFAAVRPVSHGGDPVVSRCRNSNVRDLAFHAQYLLLKRSRGHGVADRTADNLHEVAKAMGKVT